MIIGIMQGDRQVAANRAEGPDLLIISTLSIQLLACVGKPTEPVRIQVFRPELQIERLHASIVGELTRPRKVQRDVIGVGPQTKILRVNSLPSLFQTVPESAI